MASTEQESREAMTAGGPPTLPPNVSIFSPNTGGAAKALLNGHIFTRLTVSAQVEPALLAAALNSEKRPQINETFCFSHRNVVLIFDAEADGKDLQDAHHEHFREVCLSLKDHDINLDVAGCVFDASKVIQAGFQLDELSSGSILVVDIMNGGDEDEESDDDGEDNGGPVGSEGFQIIDNSGLTMS